MRRVPLTTSLAAVAAAVAVLTGCSSPTPMDRVEPTGGEEDRSGAAEQESSLGEPEPDPEPAELAEYYGQQLDWQECGPRECATVTVPVDYAEPAGETIELAVQRRSADGESLGSLVINPGGPGGSGLEMLTTVDQMFSGDLLARYDVVAFDPRGVGESAPVDCVSDAELDELRAADYEMDTQQGIADFRADARRIAEGCAAGSGPVLRHIDTRSAARDMDVLRASLGEDDLDYLGYSYGTLLGSVYAETFPGRVGRMVLDGAMDPSLTASEISRDQAEAFEQALRAYVEDCQAGPQCPLDGDVEDGMEQIRTLLDLAGEDPLPTADGRELTAPLALSGILTALYNVGNWPVLTSALEQAIGQSDGSQLMFLADFQAGRTEDGSYRDNSTEANWAINCLDHPVRGNLEQWRSEAEDLAEAAPTFGPSLSYGDLLCEPWSVDGDGVEGPVQAAGAAPILVVGTTGDPATPYRWSESLTEQLASGTLLTYEGEGHTAYGSSNACVTEAVDAYLIDGVVPEDGTMC